MPTPKKLRLERMQYWNAERLRKLQRQLKLSRPELKLILRALQFVRYDARQPVTWKESTLESKIKAYLNRRT